jgi:hypothetical protein
MKVPLFFIYFHGMKLHILLLSSTLLHQQSKLKVHELVCFDKKAQIFLLRFCVVGKVM